jgi:hypothetical protein
MLRPFVIIAVLSLVSLPARAQITWEEVPGVGWRVLSAPEELPSSSTVPADAAPKRPAIGWHGNFALPARQSNSISLGAGCTRYQVRSEYSGGARIVQICH